MRVPSESASEHNSSPSTDAALEADRLLEAFAGTDMGVLRDIEAPSEEAIAALLMFTTLSIRALAEDRPGMSESSIRLRLRRLVAELLARPTPTEEN